MSGSVQPEDLAFFSVLAGRGSLTATARELGISTAAVSKHLAQMEARAAVALVNRTTRRMSLTAEGEIYLAHARRILGEMEELAQLLGGARAAPKGLLRVNATLGFGRSHVAPVISRFVQRFPEVDVQLQLSVDPPPISSDAYDVCVRFGEPPDARVIARRIAPNRRLLCAAPAYLAQHRMPKTPADLTHHNCIGIRQGDDGYGIWRLTSGRGAAQKNRDGARARQSDHERRRDRREVGARRSRHPDARRVGHHGLSAHRRAGACAARIPDTGCGYLRGLFAAASDVGESARVYRFSDGVARRVVDHSG